MTSHQLSVQTLKTYLEDERPLFIVDVRTPEEYRAVNLGGYLIPLAELPQRFHEVPRDKRVVIHCRSGVRSQTALTFLQGQGYTDVYNLEGGIEAWWANNR